MSRPSETSIVAGSKRWNRRVYDEVISTYPGAWAFAATRGELDALVDQLGPRRIFFLHWSWIVPEPLLNQCECIGFHMTDLPYGRGGSPLQNLIVRGHRSTRLTAFRMTQQLDGGPVYDKRDLDLHGTAEEIYVRSSYLAADMVRSIAESDNPPVPQAGPVVPFARRTPAESEIPSLGSLLEVYDFIRMLDAEGYPRGFIRSNGLRLEFRRAALYDGRLEADVIITRDEAS